MKKILISILKFHNGQTTNGISRNADTAWLFVEGTKEEVIAYCNENNIDPKECLIYEDRHLWGEHYPICVPVISPKGVVGPMMGGNYAIPCGSNLYFPKYEKLPYTCVPIPIHDRHETQEDYYHLTR